MPIHKLVGMVTPVRQFQFLLASSGGWDYSAQKLRDAADALFRFHFEGLRQLLFDGDTDLHERNYEGVGLAILLLAGLAIENLAKGLWILENPEELSNDRLPKRLSKGHEMTVDLFQEADIRLTTKEKAFITRLQVFVTWAGRYPVPKHVDNMKVQKTFRTDDFEQFKKLFDRLKALLRERRRAKTGASLRQSGR